MGIFRTDNPTMFEEIDGIVIAEQTPPSQITGANANTAILAGQFQRGPTDLSLPLSSIAEFQELYGKSNFLGNKQLLNKTFGALRIIRVTAAAAVKATLEIDSKITVTAKYTGAYGNDISVEVAAGTAGTFTLIVKDTSDNSVLPDEVYTDVDITNVGNTFANSKLVDVVVDDANSGNVAVTAVTTLKTGSDGVVADTDYQTAIAKAEVEESGNVLFLDENNDVRNTYLTTHAELVQDKMVILAGEENDDRAAAIADAAMNKDIEGRIIYAWPWVQTVVDGQLEFTNPSSWVASVFSQVAPNVALSRVQNTRYFAGATGLKFQTGRAGHIALDDGGVLAFEIDSDFGIVIKNAVTTQTANSENTQILRRRMADFLTTSIARALKNFQNGVNSRDQRDEVKAAILDFDERLIRDGILPGIQDVNGGAPVLVDTESLNTDSVVAGGGFRIAYKRRIFSSMRYIVLQAEIGTGVVVTEI